ncbi:MAG: hypothetical protein JEZ01_21040 [Labilibaculum sp.]|nr:hypothetical protein [Labilibaculum sp.]MBI9060266.1 hypothetical protein [Labilibaculum sp.]
MTSQNPSSDFASDLLLLINNSENYFNIEFPLNIQTNFTLLNTAWKEYGFSNMNGERSALNYAVGNFINSYLNNNYLENPYSIIFDGWSMLYFDKDLSKQSIINMESHFVIGILTVFTNFRYLKLTKEECIQPFYSSVDPYLSQRQQFDQIISSSDIPNSAFEEVENEFTFDSYIKNFNTNTIPDKMKDYFNMIIENRELFQSTYLETYEKAHKYINKQVNLWSKGSTLFSI